MPSTSLALESALSVLRQRAGSAFGPPQVALVLGSGLGAIADSFSDSAVVPYAEIPGMPVSSVAGHAGQLRFGRWAGRSVVAMQGRAHLYEGYSPEQVVFGVRLMLRAGARVLVVSNAAGGIRADLTPGSCMVIDDHLNLTGHNCLRGPNDDALGPRFPDMSAAYDPELSALAICSAEQLQLPAARGVYAGLLGPSYETPAEIRMLRTLGADAVGMSTVLEVIAARHMASARVLGLSCITNPAAGLGNTALSHREVEETALRMRAQLTQLLYNVLSQLPA
jgi:purine-nucleoside phosphorylase